MMGFPKETQIECQNCAESLNGFTFSGVDTFLLILPPRVGSVSFAVLSKRSKITEAYSSSLPMCSASLQFTLLIQPS